MSKNYVRLMFVVFLYCLLTGCRTDDSDIGGCLTSLSTSKVMTGVSALDARKAFEGNLSSSQHIVEKLTTGPADRFRPNHAQLCQAYFWRDIAAQNGDLASAYELATSYDDSDFYMCNRSHFWAKKALGRVDEFESKRNPGASPAERSAATSRRAAELVEVLRHVCN